MNHWRVICSLLALAVVVLAAPGLAQANGLSLPDQPQAPLGTGFTYQGYLTDGEGPADGAYDFQFSLYSVEDGGSPLGTLTLGDQAVTGGYFTVLLDFGAGMFDGSARWLAIGVRGGAETGDYTPLDPRQALSAAPYAMYAPSAGAASTAAYAATSPWTGITGLPTGFADGVDDDTDTNTTYTAGDGLTLTGTEFDVNFGGGGIATTVSRSDHTHANFWFITGNSQTDPAVNFIGTRDNQPLIFRVNNLQALRIEPNDTSPNLIGGYLGNSVAAGVVGATIGGGGFSGYPNQVTGVFGIVGGGFDNTASGDGSTVGGGNQNTAHGFRSIVGGGFGNTTDGDYATAGGGNANIASGWSSTVSGGGGNEASGDYATVAGGSANTAAGDHSFVAGWSAANINDAHDGVFIYSDNSSWHDFPSTAANQFRVRSTGGAQFVTGIDGSGNPTAGVQVVAGGGSWSAMSDVNMKANFGAVDTGAVLEAVAGMPISTWNYIAQDETIRHIGPMAQDFYAAFGVGEDDTHITTIDADGVALAAIQGLNEVVEEKDSEIAALHARVTALELSNRLASTGLLTPSTILSAAACLLAGLAFLRTHKKAGRNLP
ncbi:MAG TPA: tail fiber domain-containing protein [Anaerolineaceae bacterium]|nr:tail fiber domain-containing protein [Anaerolineaceae bacterium]